MSKDIEVAVGEPQVSGEELAARFRQGDVRAFDDIVKCYQQRIFNLAYRMLNQYEEAADLTQEIFVKIYRSMDKFRGESSFTTWVYAIAVNMGRNKLRSFRHRPALNALSTDAPLETENGRMAMELPDPGRSPGEQVERVEVCRELEGCLAKLPPEFAAALVMRDLQQMTYEEIAAAMQCSLGTVKSRIARGRLLAMEKLKKIYHQ
ncbi:MAG: sigma-70 family RNA polymerase sigma factor [Verrucomicrobia bacterium]|nr:sigma-70 family RNA polymerase sigma factor [Verrucomicrobiota bacterium]MCG2681803.1 sigma-70 family RNA polymerase sigma factor [Kiritimatiellia bacterium]MBU4247284.1 sigma-70 family RNA polymerase sigma factor [Verrucomicrobiota bacterium]MBU4289900.1 sigma-70 family RNA polymerase sigma factor [Verrucomicrobiota bacterium]MBU4427956.1 sigma-70 family RNA polymerase sigma factor [Verrucomicrobiota bacterium]